jgi:hypothetical protein
VRFKKGNESKGAYSIDAPCSHFSLPCIAVGKMSEIGLFYTGELGRENNLK